MSSEESDPKPNKNEEVTESEDNSKSQTKPVANKKGPKNWDKIAKDLGADDEDEGDADQLFKKLYAQADEETRRAMNKSFVESNGTTLSMDWKKVSKKFVKPYKDKASDEELSSSDSDSEDERKGMRRINMKDLREKSKP